MDDKGAGAKDVAAVGGQVLRGGNWMRLAEGVFIGVPFPRSVVVVVNSFIKLFESSLLWR